MKEIELGLAMKAGMRRLASGVSVLSSVDCEGQRYAMTVSSATSLSDDPASLLVCVHQNTAMYELLNQSGSHFAINILSANQEDVSNLCAGGAQGEERFAAGDWQEGFEGIPYLESAQSVFYCDTDASFDYGTHRIIVGKMKHILVSETAVDPLIYLDGGYHRLS